MAIVAPNSDEKKPTAPPVQEESIPAFLRELPQWVCWRYERRKHKQTKVPYQPGGRRAKSDNSATWTTFEQAMTAYRRGSFDGIGFMLAQGGGLVAWDIDNALDPTTGELEAWALEIVERLNSYTEITPSGRGLRIFALGQLPHQRHGRRKGQLEVYAAKRYVTVTGRRFPGTPATIEDRQDEINEVFERYFSGQANGKEPTDTMPAQGAEECAETAGNTLDDWEIVAKARKAKNGSKFAKLFDHGDISDYGDDDSAADQALCNMLAFWTRDPAQIERVFSQSALGVREKWRGRPDYRERTIAKALEDVKEHYGTSKRPDKDALLVDAPGNPLPTTRRFVRDFFTQNGIHTLAYYRDEFLHWSSDGGWRVLEAAVLRKQLYGWLEKAWYYDHNDKPQPFKPNQKKINDLIDALKGVVLVGKEIETPAWLGDAANMLNFPAEEYLAFSNGLLHTETGFFEPLVPDYFALHTLPFPYDPSAGEPATLLKVLRDQWRDDEESIETVQEMLGLLLTTDVSYHKMFALIGPPRSGKGLLAGVIRNLVGDKNFASPTLEGLTQQFGLQPLVGRRVAVIGDARLAGRLARNPVVVERLLNISGGDVVTIDRKHKAPWVGRLPTRIVIMSNELPQLLEASGALANRFIVLRFTKSFLGNEDHTLEMRLLRETAAIGMWALEGLKRLRSRGYFRQPASSESLKEDLLELTSPITAFVNDCCDLGPGFSVESDELYKAWSAWCFDRGQRPSNKPQFGRDLIAAYSDLRKTRPRVDGVRLYVYEGIKLNERGRVLSWRG